jgi:hypothetical protein
VFLFILSVHRLKLIVWSCLIMSDHVWSSSSSASATPISTPSSSSPPNKHSAPAHFLRLAAAERLKNGPVPHQLFEMRRSGLKHIVLRPRGPVATHGDPTPTTMEDGPITACSMLVFVNVVANSSSLIVLMIIFEVELSRITNMTKHRNAVVKWISQAASSC